MQSRRNVSGLRAPEDTWKYAGSPGSGGWASTATIAATTWSTGTMSTMVSPAAGNSGSSPRP